jgi:predicted DNA-binding mobile mystery protein A
MRNKRKLLVEQLDQKLKYFKGADKLQVPVNGWLNAIRLTLNMTMAQLGERLSMTRQGVKGIEEREANGTITINVLKEAAKALDLKLVYGFVSKENSLDDLITKRCDILARKIVLRTNQNMKLENQGIDEGKIEKSIKELSSEIKREMKKAIWD